MFEWIVGIVLLAGIVWVLWPRSDHKPEKLYRNDITVTLKDGSVVRHTYLGTECEFLSADVTRGAALIIRREWAHPDAQGWVSLCCYGPGEWLRWSTNE
jgi:hypothetical protein